VGREGQETGRELKDARQVLSDVVAIQKYGNTSTRATSARKPIVRVRIKRFLLVMGPSCPG
jgi:hypothetical protein